MGLCSTKSHIMKIIIKKNTETFLLLLYFLCCFTLSASNLNFIYSIKLELNSFILNKYLFVILFTSYNLK